MLSHLVAASENNIIGSHNELPWKLPNDFRYFKNKTWGMPVIMGRQTYESLKKELPGRINIVLTKKTEWRADNVQVAYEISDAIALAGKSDCREIFIIGGGEIFKQTIGLIDRIYLTRVHAKVEGDTFYPEINKEDWQLSYSEPHEADEKNNIPYTFEIWDRIKK